MGAGTGSAYAVGGTGGSADSVVVTHTHTVSDPGAQVRTRPSESDAQAVGRKSEEKRTHRTSISPYGRVLDRRSPTKLLRSVGSSPKRVADRKKDALVFQAPPRRPRNEPDEPPR